MFKKYAVAVSLTLALWTSPLGAVDLAGVDVHGFVSQGFLWSGDNNYFSSETSDGSF